MDRKQSKFIEVQSISDDDYLGFFGSSVNRKISWAAFKTLILDFLAINFLIGSPSTVNALSLMSLPLGAMVRTKGCLSIGDGGHGLFIIEEADGSPDGFSRVLLNNGLHAVLQLPYNIVQFGAIGDGVSPCHSAIVRAFSALPYCKTMHIPSGTYVIDASVARATPYTSGRSCFDITSIDDFTIYGDGKNQSILLFKPTDSRSARMLDINLSDRHTLKDFACVGFEFPDVDPPTSTGAFLDRFLNVVRTDGSKYLGLLVKNVTMYGMAYERGAYTNNIWEDIDFENVGNDCIDMKSQNIDAIYVADINKNNRWKNITAKNWGCLQFQQPNVLLDMRSSYSSAENITGFDCNDNSYLVRNIAGIGNTISNPVCYGTDADPSSGQIGIVCAAPMTKIYNPKLFGLYKGIENVFNSEDGRAPSFDCYSPTIDGCYISIDTTNHGNSRVFGGSILNSIFRGVRIGANVHVIGVTFSGTVSGISTRFEVLADRSVVAYCKDDAAGTAQSASAGISALNSIINCGTMASSFKVDILGRTVLVDGVQVLSSQGAAVANAAGGTEITTINNILSRLRAHGIIAT